MERISKKENYVSIFDTLSARRNLFGVTDQAMKLKGHEVEWFEKAEGISGGYPVQTLMPANGEGSIVLDYFVPDNKKWINNAGNVILDKGYNDFKNLYRSPVALNGAKAAKWDKEWLSKEKKALQPVHKKYIEPYSIGFFENSGVVVGDFLNLENRIEYGCSQFSHNCKYNENDRKD